MRERARRAADLHEETLSAYVSRLIVEDTPLGAAVAAQLPAVLGHRCVRLIDALAGRIERGEALDGVAQQLEGLRRMLAFELSRLRGAYDRTLDATNDPSWDGHE
ncbi:MAG: hypothetical protein ACYDGM_08845 [Vulcanimicrobiaceae bacterium]